MVFRGREALGGGLALNAKDTLALEQMRQEFGCIYDQCINDEQCPSSTCTQAGVALHCDTDQVFPPLVRFRRAAPYQQTLVRATCLKRIKDAAYLGSTPPPRNP